MDNQSIYENMGNKKIINLAQNENEEAIEYLINTNLDLVYSKVNYFFIKGAGKEDVIQEGMIGLYQAIKSYKLDTEYSFRSFCDLCIRRNIITAVRKADTDKKRLINNSVSFNRSNYRWENSRSLNNIIADKRYDPESKYIKHELLNEIEEYLELKLTNLERIAFREFLNGKSYNDIARIVNRGVKSVDNALQRVRKKIDRFKNELIYSEDYIRC